jgi:hypothetical protein
MNSATFVPVNWRDSERILEAGVGIERKGNSATDSRLSPHQELAPTAQVESKIVADFAKARRIRKLSQNAMKRIPTEFFRWKFRWESAVGCLNLPRFESKFGAIQVAVAKFS